MQSCSYRSAARAATRSAPSPFFFQAPPPAATYTLSLHDALPIWLAPAGAGVLRKRDDRRPVGHRARARARRGVRRRGRPRSEEHTSELQSRENLVCRLLLEKKNPPKQAQLLQAGPE